MTNPTYMTENSDSNKGEWIQTSEVLKTFEVFEYNVSLLA